MFKTYNLGLLRTMGRNAAEARSAFNLDASVKCYRVVNLSTSAERRVFADNAEEALRFCAGPMAVLQWGRWGVYSGDWGVLFRGDES